MKSLTFILALNTTVGPRLGRSLALPAGGLEITSPKSEDDLVAALPRCERRRLTLPNPANFQACQIFFRQKVEFQRGVSRCCGQRLNGGPASRPFGLSFSRLSQ